MKKTNRRFISLVLALVFMIGFSLNSFAISDKYTPISRFVVPDGFTVGDKEYGDWAYQQNDEWSATIYIENGSEYKLLYHYINQPYTLYEVSLMTDELDSVDQILKNESYKITSSIKKTVFEPPSSAPKSYSYGASEVLRQMKSSSLHGNEYTNRYIDSEYYPDATVYVKESLSFGVEHPRHAYIAAGITVAAAGTMAAASFGVTTAVAVKFIAKTYGLASSTAVVPYDAMVSSYRATALYLRTGYAAINPNGSETPYFSRSKSVIEYFVYNEETEVIQHVSNATENIYYPSSYAYSTSAIIADVYGMI